jgi:hypothetical protein
MAVIAMVWHRCLLTTNDEHRFTGEALALCGGQGSAGWQLPVSVSGWVTGGCRRGNWKWMLLPEGCRLNELMSGACGTNAAIEGGGLEAEGNPTNDLCQKKAPTREGHMMK